MLWKRNINVKIAEKKILPYRKLLKFVKKKKLKMIGKPFEFNIVLFVPIVSLIQ